MPHKPSKIYISKEKWIEAKHIIKNGIVKKLSAARKSVDINKEVAAGIYIYALEEFGKLLLLKECKADNGKYIIKYRDEFLSHPVKFSRAFDHLQDNGYGECIVLNDEGSFDPIAYSWRSYIIGLLAQTEARLGIFYVDFVESENNEYDILKVPNVDHDKLSNAINKFEGFINTFAI